MNTVKSILSNQHALTGSLRILTGATYSGKRAIYLSGTPEGFRLMANLLNAQAEAAENEFTKLERDKGELFFTTTDSVDIFEMHNHHPAAHPSSVGVKSHSTPGIWKSEEEKLTLEAMEGNGFR